MNIKTSKWIDEHKNEMVSVLQKAIAFRSVRDDDTAGPGAPFGKGAADCLGYVLAEAEKMGFAVTNYDGYAGAIDCGSGKEQLGILAHLDVVPEGSGWTYPPFAGEIHDGKLYGRGALDDKGPGIAALFALAAVKNSGLKFTRRVRIILGCDEECDMGCLQHYRKVEKLPDLAFSPDAEYPLINSEKMNYTAEYGKKYESKICMKGGTVPNAVMGECSVYLPLPEAVVKAAADGLSEVPGIKIALKAQGSGTSVLITGLAAHASTPKLGYNAFYAALDLVRRLPLGEDADTAEALFGMLRYDMHGERFGIDAEDASGRSTLCCGVIDWDEKGINRLTVDVRAPISADAELITMLLQKGFALSGCTQQSVEYSDGYCVSPDSEIVTKLLSVYNEYFKTDAKPMAIGGGTYARCLKNAVAFGPERPGELACIHMADECVDLEHLTEDAKIYADAIIALACEEKQV